MERFMKSNLDIAMFGHKRIPSREGGIEIVVEELCTGWLIKETGLPVITEPDTM